MQRFRDQAEHQGTEIVTADVSKVDFSQRPFKVWVEDTLYLAQTVIIATGRARTTSASRAKRPSRTRASAPAPCATARSSRNQPVVVIGGGDTAMEEATYLSSLCSHVTLIHRRDEFRASKSMIDRTVANPKIKILYSHVVDEVLDVKEDTVTGVVVKDLKTGDKHTIQASAMFVAIGHTPMTELFTGQLETHENGYLKTEPGSTRTNIPGVFAAGDVQDWTYRQAVTAAGSGCMAALDAERWLAAEGGH